MRSRVVLGNTVSLIGCVALAVALRQLLVLVEPLGGSCGGDAQPCPDGVGSGAVMLFLGFFAALIGGLSGGGPVTMLISLSVGVGCLLAAHDLPAGHRGLATVLGIGFSAAGVLQLLLLPRQLLRRRKALRLVDLGAPAIGRIVRIEDTGIEVNDRPRVRLHYAVRPQDGSAPFDMVKTVDVSVLRAPKVGQCHAVLYDRDDPQQCIVIVEAEASAPERIRQLVAAAESLGPN